MSEEEKQRIADEIEQKELESIYKAIVEKAEFMVKLQVPEGYKDPEKEHGGLLLIQQQSSSD